MNSASPGRTAVPGSLHGEGRFLLPRREFEPAYLKTHRAGLHNINFVTPEHVVPQILEALPLAIEGGLCVPLVYNTRFWGVLTLAHKLLLMSRNPENIG